MTLMEDFTTHLRDELFFGDPGARLDVDDDLFELGLDSLAIQRLVVRIERKLRVRVSDSDVVAENFRTVRALVTMVEGLTR